MAKQTEGGTASIRFRWFRDARNVGFENTRTKRLGPDARAAVGAGVSSLCEAATQCLWSVAASSRTDDPTSTPSVALPVGRKH